MATGFEEFEKVVIDLKKRVEALERLGIIRKVTIPADGFLIVPIHAADPTAANGKIYYNSSTNKFKVCENNVWKTITTT